MNKLILMICSLLLIGNEEESVKIKQTDLLEKAGFIGSFIDYPETIQSLLVVESLNLYGVDDLVGCSKKDPCYGVLQIKPDTAVWIINKTVRKEIVNEQTIMPLLEHPYSNLVIGTLYFDYLIKEECNDNWNCAIVSYNLGPTGARKYGNLSGNPYLIKVKEALTDVVRPFNQI